MKKEKGLEITVNVGVIVILVILNIPSILASYSLLAEYNLANSDYIFKTIIGRSMSPTLKRWDTILIKKGVEDIGVGDIIFFKVDSIPVGVTHRVIDIQGDPVLTFQTKGDANEMSDEWNITANQVRGKVVSVIPTSLLMISWVLYAPIVVPTIGISARVVYCFSKKNIRTKESKYSIFNLTTILSAVLMAFSVARLFVLILFTSTY